MVSLFNGISLLISLFNAKAIIGERQQYYLTYCKGNKRVHAFFKGIPKVNVTARLLLTSKPEFSILAITPRGLQQEVCGVWNYPLTAISLGSKFFNLVCIPYPTQSCKSSHMDSAQCPTGTDMGTLKQILNSCPKELVERFYRCSYCQILQVIVEIVSVVIRISKLNPRKIQTDYLNSLRRKCPF